MKSGACILGITGAVGSGKSVVMKLLQVLYDVPIFDSDQEAKEVYHEQRTRQAVSSLISEDPIDSSGQLKKGVISDYMGQSLEHKKALETVIHQGVREKFELWLVTKAMEHPVVALESAILYSSGFVSLCDVVWIVKAPQQVRSERVLVRDGGGEERFRRIERLQLEERKLQEVGYNIIKVMNERESSLVHQVEELYTQLL